MKRTLLSRLAALVILCLASSPLLSSATQTPGASPVATADPFALPANLRILRIQAGNGFDFVTLEGGLLAYLDGDLVDDGLSRVPVPQWLETWYTDMQVMDHYFSWAAMVAEDGRSDGVIIDIRLLAFPDQTAAAAAVPATFDVLQRQAEDSPTASQDITMHPDPPAHDQAIIGVTGTDLTPSSAIGMGDDFIMPFTRFIAQHGAIVASVKVTSPDDAFNDAVARELLVSQLACLDVNEMCVPVPLPAGIPFGTGTPVAASPVHRSRSR